jgi:hypothetical protein
MANCLFGITADILYDCDQRPTSGAEEFAYAMNRTDIETITYNATNKHNVTGITMKSDTIAYKISGFKKEIDAGADLVASDTNPDKYNQYFKFEPWQIDAATTKALDNLSDLVIIVERKNKGLAGDGAFMILGLETGLYKSADASRINSDSGKRIIEMTNQADEESTISKHIFFSVSYSASKLAIEALLPVPPAE